MKITFRKFKDNETEYVKIYNWCKNDFVFAWFEQRILSFEEIKEKYKNKHKEKKQELLIIQCNSKDIGLVQIYKYKKDININYLNNFNNIYEFDLFIGEKEYLSRGIGTKVVNLINKKINGNYNADAIILRPFNKNIRAIKCYQKCNYKIITEYEGKDTLNNSELISVLLNTKNTDD